MSTLYEALKKAEKTQHVQNVLLAQDTQQTKAPGKPKRAIPVVVVALFALFFIFSVMRAVSVGKAASSTKKKPDSAASVNKHAAMASNVPQQAVAVKKTYTGHELEGVICNGDSCVTVINGKLLKLQDTIDSLILTKISPGSVELSNPKDDSATILELK